MSPFSLLTSRAARWSLARGPMIVRRSIWSAWPAMWTRWTTGRAESGSLSMQWASTTPKSMSAALRSTQTSLTTSSFGGCRCSTPLTWSSPVCWSPVWLCSCSICPRNVERRSPCVSRCYCPLQSSSCWSQRLYRPHRWWFHWSVNTCSSPWSLSRSPS